MKNTFIACKVGSTIKFKQQIFEDCSLAAVWLYHVCLLPRHVQIQIR